MDIQATKLDLLQSILSLEKESLLLKIKELIDSEMIVGYTTAGEPLTKYQYKKRLDEASKEMKDGKFYTHEEVGQIIKNW
jgi:hypothetical protein